MIPSCRPPSATTGRWWPAVTPRSRPSRPTWPPRPPSRPSPRPWLVWAPTGVSASWVRCRWPPRSATGDASPTQPGSWPSPGWSPASVPPATASGAATSPAPAASTCASNWWSRPGPIITAPHRRRPPPAPTAGGRRHPGPLLGGPAGPVPPLPAAGTPQAHHRRGRGRRRPGACRVPVGRDAGLTCMPPTLGRSPIGAPAPASPRTRRSTADAGKIPATLLPRQDGATHQVWGHGLRTADLRSRPANIRVAVRRSTPLRRGPGQPSPGHLADAPSEHQELLTGGSPLDGAVPYQKVKRVGHGFRNFTNYRLRLLLHCGVSWPTHHTARLRGRSPHLAA